MKPQKLPSISMTVIPTIDAGKKCPSADTRFIKIIVRILAVAFNTSRQQRNHNTEIKAHTNTYRPLGYILLEIKTASRLPLGLGPGINKSTYVGSIAHRGARCSSVVRAFAHGAMGRRIDPASAPRLV